LRLRPRWAAIRISPSASLPFFCPVWARLRAPFRYLLERETGDQNRDEVVINTNCVHEDETQAEKTKPNRDLDQRHPALLEPFHCGELKLSSDFCRPLQL